MANFIQTVMYNSQEMNTFFKQAEDFIAREVGSECGIVPESVQDLSDLYGFTYQSRKFLKSGKHEEIVVGQGYTFINKLDNRVFSFGSGCGFEEAVIKLRKKLLQETEIKKLISEFDVQKRFDLKISNVLNKQILVDTLLKFGLTYIIPEKVGSVIFRIEKRYKKLLLWEKLSDLPIKFHGVNQGEFAELIIELIKNSSCEFEVIEHTEKKFANYVDKALEVDLKTVW